MIYAQYDHDIFFRLYLISYQIVLVLVDSTRAERQRTFLFFVFLDMFIYFKRAGRLFQNLPFSTKYFSLYIFFFSIK